VEHVHGMDHGCGSGPEQCLCPARCDVVGADVQCDLPQLGRRGRGVGCTSPQGIFPPPGSFQGGIVRGPNFLPQLSGGPVRRKLSPPKLSGSVSTRKSASRGEGRKKIFHSENGVKIYVTENKENPQKRGVWICLADQVFF